MSAPADPGAQPERTELAWRRTVLSLAVGSLVSMRFFPELFGDVRWAVPGIAGLVAAGIIALAARRRYRLAASRCTPERRAPERGSRCRARRCCSPSPSSCRSSG
ncbi:MULTISPECIES: DUF202 domain-containing protein [unclassified Microbacterium]|uniref:DUF202 domain-containing protein n=1 Tax=unclassified Microbacterium TaxID=2609290 RepID=UPI000A46BB7E|nr:MULTISPECIES: DUF202 domain-containing protein [unclassified Microbacterium]MBN9224369.1 DUF202 domain-containing protein [Microbacterium sp.]